MEFNTGTPKRVFVAGHRGLVGSAVVRLLEQQDQHEILVTPRTSLDLRNQAQVERWFEEHRPDQVYLVAGTVGGIWANKTRPAEFLYDNLMIHANVIEAARKAEVEKVLYLGSSCIYPRQADQPISEDALLKGPLEETNEGYALAKIAGIKMCDYYREQHGCNFISAMPTNLYGPNDNFDLQNSHVLPALMRKFHEAKVNGDKEVMIWGTGSALREFLHVDDLADACLFLMENYDEAGHVNVGTGVDLAIRSLAEAIRDVVNPDAELVFDTSKPDGTPRKVLDTSKLENLGWKPKINLLDGIEQTYSWFLDQVASGSLRGY